MASSVRRIVLTALLATVTTLVLVGLISPSFTQMQDNSAIRISNSQEQPVLSVACNTEGSVAYVTDGRNVYRYATGPGADGAAWQCILSQTQRLQMAAQYDPCEAPLVTQ